jgi:cytochrome c biogenesis protein CcmG, thiol:disulfide interchange protein DsbE
MMTEQREFSTPESNWRRLGQTVLLGGLIVLLGLLVWRQVTRPRPGEEGLGTRHPAVGQSLAKFSVEPLTGGDQPLGLDDLAGKVSLINIWGTWCGPCLDEFPHLKELAEHYRSRPDFRFVSLSCSAPGADDDDLAENTAALLNEQRADFPTYADPTWQAREEIGRVTGELRGIPYPTTLLLGRDGKIRAVWFGYSDGLTGDMRNAIEDALAEQADSAGG